MLSLEQGAALVALARKAIESQFSMLKLKVDKSTKEEFSHGTGCFVTLHKDQLRGCIGYPEAMRPLWESIVAAAQGAAFQDPRFSAVEKNEMDEISVEVSVLTRPKRVDVHTPSDYLKKIKIGKDGLIIRSTYSSGLLLPQVAVEQKWDVRTFLQNACLKAQLQPHDWENFDLTRVYTFHSQVFGETQPRGEVIQIM